MSAGLEGFLTGFFGARAEGMQRDQDKADAYEERMRNIAQRNSIIAQNRTSMADAAKSMGDKLLAWGATPKQIQAALGSGQTGLADLYKTVSTVHNTLGPEETKRFLGSENVGADLGMAKAVSEEGLNNLYKSTFGMPMGMKTGDYKAPEESTLAKLFGYTDRKAKVMQELDAELSGTGGYSVYDLTTIGSLPDYIPGSAGESITYRTPSIYTKAEYSDAIDDVRKDITMVRQSGAFENAEKSIANLDAKILEQKMSEAYDQATVERLEGLKAKEIEKRDGLLDRALKETILTKSNMYFNSDTYLGDMQSFVESNLGYTPSWMGELIESEKAVNEVVNKSLGGSLTGQPESQTAAALNDAKPTVVNTITTESGKTYDVVEQGGVKLVRDPASGKTMNEALSKEFIDAAVEVDAIKDVKPTYTSKVGEMPEAEYELPDVSSPKDKANAVRKQSEKRASELEAATDVVREVSTGGIKATADFLDRWVLGASVGYAQKPIATLTSGLAYLADKTGFESLAEGLYVASYDMSKGAEDMLEKGFIENIMDKAGSTEYPESAFVNDMLDYLQPSIQKPMGEVSEEESAAMVQSLKDNLAAMYNVVSRAKQDTATVEKDSIDAKSERGFGKTAYTSGLMEPSDSFKQPEEEPDYAAAAQRAPDHIVKLGEQATKAWGELAAKFGDDEANRRAAALYGKAQDTQTGGGTFSADASGVDAAMVEQEAQDTGYKAPKIGATELNVPVIREALQSNKPNAKEAVMELMSILKGKELQEGYGVKEEQFTEEENTRLNELRASNPEFFIDTAPELLGAGMPASEYDTTFKSRTDRPTGMMSPMPATDAELEGTPTIGTDTELDNMLVRVHGKKGDAMQSFLSKVRTGKAKTADVTRIINSTKKLPKTGTRDTVLEKLYALRDSMK